MHEYHIVEDIVKQVLEKARGSNAKKIMRVTLTLGEFSGFKGEPVRAYFENLSKSTLLEGAELIIKPAKLKLKCKDCGEIFEHEKADFKCPKCGSEGMLINPNNELYIDNIEIETDE